GSLPDKGTYTIDSTTKPKSMTVTGTEGPNNGKTFPAIYELKGDQLRICYDLSGAKRPTEFKSIAGTQLYLVTYNRKKE
ncbi:MAG TPA: TIGR03067 domain-containing protein, partial [Verrucomicrobiae bacterium]|nr:TIGR03067 domain-containing protein [Verrucomicrobiae bacterium]